jgi:hypothetical protein
VLAKELPAKDIHKEMIPVYADKCLSRKAVHSWRKNVFKDALKFDALCQKFKGYAISREGYADSVLGFSKYAFKQFYEEK